MSARLGVVLLGFGGPEKLDDVEPFLVNLFEDPYVLDLPFGTRWLRPWLARRIARRRVHEARLGYETLGGGSPINKTTRAQAVLLEAELRRRGHDVVVEVSQRVWYPRSEEAAKKLAAAGIARGIAVPLYPQFARVTTLSAFDDWDDAWKRAGAPDVPWSRVRSFPDHPRYVEAVARDVRATLERVPEAKRATTALLLSAHGLPLRSARHPQETYVAEVERTAAAVRKALAWEGKTLLAWQSRVGPLRWLEPSLDQAIESLRRDGATGAVVYPLAFVSDHSETLYELDQQYGAKARALGFEWYRVPALNENAVFIDALADLVEDAQRPSSPGNVTRLPGSTPSG